MRQAEDAQSIQPNGCAQGCAALVMLIIALWILSTLLLIW